MGKFTTWITTGLAAATDVVGDSVRLAKKTFGVAPSDAEIELAASKVQQAVQKVEAVIAEALDEIPGVPRFVAKLAAQGVAQILMAAVASAAEAAKDAN